MHEGEIGVNVPAPAAAQAANFWNTPNSVLAAAKAGAAAAKVEGKNPISLVQRVAQQRGPSAAKVLCNPVNTAATSKV